MTRVLSDVSAIFQKSAGEPRRTPPIASPAPRSSTQRPQLTQSILPPFFFASAIAAAPNRQQITSSVQAALQKSFGSAADIAKQYPQYASHITHAAKTSFLAGDQWAYLSGIVVILLGAVLVFFIFPKMDEEKKLLAEYHAEDTDVAA